MPGIGRLRFLSSNTQDFIEVTRSVRARMIWIVFLSSNTQDFIEVDGWYGNLPRLQGFLSSNTQDFIEVLSVPVRWPTMM